MLTASYHNHTVRCNHATGTEREYIEKAIESGIKIFGFSDHTPYPFPKDYESTFRMKLEDMDDYCDTVLRLRDEYKDDIEIHLGLEVEYYPLYFDALNEFIKDYPIEYYILGQHLILNEIEVIRDGFSCPPEQDLRQYADQCIEAMETGRFIYLAHPDVHKSSCSDDIYRREMLRICKAAKRLNIPLEINLLGIEDNRNYPDMRFWMCAAETGNDVIIGADAHHVENIYRADALEIAMNKFVKPLQLKLINTPLLF
ncbi:MAG: histidinol-phosphatase [Eubacterium sp.]|nr:histidinol-phosphatase [Eubacterium sp.]SEF47896.1 histidinol-phosphatase (PHP family) [Eubacterium ruminantium]